MKKLLLFMVVAVLSLMAEEIYATFDVEADRSAQLTMASTGVVKAFYADVGKHVKAGEILLELDNEDLKLNVELAQAEMENAAIAYRYAKQAYERYAKVRDVIDDDQFDQYGRALESAQNLLRSAKVNVALRQALFEKSVLYAPFEGVIAARYVERGDGVSNAKLDTLFELIDTSRVKLKLAFDEKYWQRVKAGQDFEFHVDGSNEKRHGRIVKVYPTADPQNRKMSAEVYTQGLVPGLFGEGVILTEN